MRKYLLAFSLAVGAFGAEASNCLLSASVAELATSVVAQISLGSKSGYDFGASAAFGPVTISSRKWGIRMRLFRHLDTDKVAGIIPLSNDWKIESVGGASSYRNCKGLIFSNLPSSRIGSSYLSDDRGDEALYGTAPNACIVVNRLSEFSIQHEAAWALVLETNKDQQIVRQFFDRVDLVREKIGTCDQIKSTSFYWRLLPEDPTVTNISRARRR